MTCPKCSANFAQGSSSCPQCGVRLLHNVSGVMKTSAVLIAAGGEREFYRSVQDVPERLRKTLIAATNSANSGIIVIADRAGREHISLGMNVPDENRDTNPPRRVSGGRGDWLRNPRYLPWLAAVLILLAVAFVAAAFLTHW